MKSRYPSPQERKLWRESNRFTQRVREPEEHTPDEQDIVTAAEAPGSSAGHDKLDSYVTGTNRDDGRRSITPLAPLPARDAMRRFKAHAQVEATLDLHGYGKEDAYDAVYRFLSHQYKLGRRHVTIITGKGRVRESVLKRELPHWLNEPRLRALLSAFAAAPPEKGGAGVTHVLLKKPRD